MGGKFTGQQTYYKVEGRSVPLEEIAKRLNLTPHGASKRINVRLARFGHLTWSNLERKIDGVPIRTTHQATKRPVIKQMREMLRVSGKTFAEYASKYRVSYMETLRVFSGQRKLKPKDIERLCDFVMATDEEERKLHLFAARDEGWKV